MTQTTPSHAMMTPAGGKDLELSALLSRIRRATSERNDVLFTKFLPIGYEATTLSSVRADLFDRVLLTKVRIGTLITLYDDFADNPRIRNPETLQVLYQLPFAPLSASNPALPISDAAMIELVSQLWNEVISAIRTFPNYSSLKDLFEFDVQQFYTANRYSELISGNPYLANQRENRAYSPHNMGILIVATVDLMASPDLHQNELGRIRSFVHQAQSISRIMNVLTTFDREMLENDVTGEIAAALLENGEHPLLPISGRHREIADSLGDERERMFKDLQEQASRIRTFDAHRYIAGLRKLQNLHESMQKEI